MLNGWKEEGADDEGNDAGVDQKTDEFPIPPSLRLAPLVTLIGLSSLGTHPAPL